jgi:hypothetical protein
MSIPFKERSEKLAGVLLSQNFIIIEKSSLPDEIMHSNFQSKFTKLFQNFSEEYAKASAQSVNESDMADEELGVCDFAIKELARYHMTASVRGEKNLYIRQQQLNALIEDITKIRNNDELESQRKLQLITYLKQPDVKNTMLRVAAKSILNSLEPKLQEKTEFTSLSTPTSELMQGNDSDSFSDEKDIDIEDEDVINIYAEVDLLIKQEAQVREEFKEAEKSDNKQLQFLIQQEHDRIRDDFSMLLEEYALPATNTNIEFASTLIQPLSVDPKYLARRKAFLENELESRELFPQERVGIATEIEVIKRHIHEQAKQVRRAMFSQYRPESSVPAKEAIIPRELLTGKLLEYPSRPGKLYLEFESESDFNHFRQVAKREGFTEEGTSAGFKGKSQDPDYRIANQKWTIELYKSLQDYLIEPPEKPKKNRPTHK